MQEKLTREKIDLGGMYVYADELGSYFGIYAEQDGKEVNVLDPTVSIDFLTKVQKDMILRARETPKDKQYRRNLHFLFPQIPARDTDEKSTQSRPPEHDGDAAPNQYLLFDQMDEEQIRDEIEGRIIEDYFYDLQFGDRHVTGISYNGVKAAVRWMAEKESAGIEIIKVDETELPDKYRFLVMARNTKLNVVLPGLASQSKKMEIWNKQHTQKITTDDPYAENKAFAKAVRNALRAHLPEPLIVQMLKVYRDRTKKVKFDS